MKNSKINYVVVGAFVLLMLASMLVTVTFLTGRTAATDTYYTVFTNVSGLKRGTQVMNEGFPIGEVKGIEPAWVEGQLRFRLALSVRQNWQFPDDSRAMVAASGILSAVAVEIRNGESSRYFAPGSVIPSGGSGNLYAVMADVADEIVTLTNQDIRPLLRTLNRTAQTLDLMLTDKGDAFLDSLLSTAQNISQRAPQITRNIEEFSRQLTRVASDQNVQNVEEMLHNLESASRNFATLSQDVQNSRRQIDAILGSLNKAVTENRGNITRSTQSLRYALEEISRNITAITHNLDSAGRNINEFSREIRQNPGALLGGRKIEDGPGVR